MSDPGVLAALREDPSQTSASLNLSEAHLRALISAGSFTTARPAMTTSHTQQSLAGQIAAMEVGTLFPPEGQGQFPAPGELPPTAVTPHGVPSGGAPQAAPTAVTPHAAPIGHAPMPIPAGPRPASPFSAPQPGRVPTGRTPAVGPTPMVAPNSRIPSAPIIATPWTSGVPTARGPVPPPSSKGQAPSPQGGVRGDGTGQQQRGGPCSGRVTCCCAIEVAVASIVADVSATAQAAITAITAIAGFD